MTHATTFKIPPLPERWPYQPRTAGAAPVLKQDVDIPGFGGGWRLLAAEDLVLDGERGNLDGAFGRGGIHRLGGVVLRPYRRGGLVRHLNERVYLTPRRFGSELAIHRLLWAAGFPTIEPLGCAWRRRAWGVEGLYLTRFEAGMPWPRAWERSAEVLPPLQEAIAALSAWGLWSPDLNATNVLLREAGGIALLDWDRAVFRPGPALPEAYRARLQRSLARLGAPESARAL